MNSISRKQVGNWLLVGVFMIVIQTLLGGITRLTESGLSITEWNVVSGTLPPLNADEWNKMFERYQQSSQYHLLNEGMQLSDFKNIFWWEYIHRLWARLFLPVFLIPLIYFIVTKKINASTVIKSLIALVLGAMQGIVGWIMVASGLKDRAWVGPVELTMHFILAMILLCYLLWIALQTLNPPPENFSIGKLKSFMLIFITLLFVQLCYGSLMAGTHAALAFPTFPKFNSQWIPENLFSQSPFISNFFQNTATIQFIHRLLGILIVIVAFIFLTRVKDYPMTKFFRLAYSSLPVIALMQMVIGILTLMNSLGSIPIVYGVAHQVNAVFLLMISIVLLYQISTAGTSAPE